MGNPHKSSDIMTFIKTRKYKDYTPNGELMAYITINGILTDYLIRSDGILFTSRKQKKYELKQLTGSILNNGYHIIHMSVENKSYTKLIHRLVAMAFIPNPENKPEVNHKDGNKSKNDMNNLEWVTESENMYHAFKTGLHIPKRGENKIQAKITENQAIKICEYLESNELTVNEIAKIIGCSDAIIDNIKTKKAWTEVSKKYNIHNHKKKKNFFGGICLESPEVHQICSEIQSGKYSLSEIGRIHNLPYSRINDIKQRKTWEHISKDYDFSNYISKRKW